MLLPTVQGAADALSVAEIIRHALSQRYGVVAGKVVHRSPSPKVTICPDQGLDEITLSKNAAVAMHRSQQQGRN